MVTPPSQLVEDERSGDRDVETGSDADHRNLDDLVEMIPSLVGNAVVLMADDNDGALVRRLQVRQAGGIIGQLDADDTSTSLALLL